MAVIRGAGIPVDVVHGAMLGAWHESARRVPRNVETHRHSWTKALEGAIASAETAEDKNYWEHELAAFERTVERLIAMRSAAYK